MFNSFKHRRSYVSTHLLLLLSFNLLCFVRVGCITLFDPASSNSEDLISNDISECSWCIKQLAREIVKRAKSSVSTFLKLCFSFLKKGYKLYL